MRRLLCLGVMVSTGLWGACGSDSSCTGSGGSGGHAGVGGQAGGGGLAGQAAGGAGGQALAPCLDPSAFASSFTIADPAFCAVALYTAPESLGSQAPTWGSHGGPLVVQTATGTDVTLERWTAPAGNTGALTVQTTPIASAVPAGAYLGVQALDLPFFGWTAISWINPFPMTTGKFEMIANGTIATSYDVNGPFSVIAVPADASLGRLIYTGLSPLGTATTNMNGLYAADACSSPSPALGAGTGCAAPSLIAAWDEYSGPVAADSDGDVFAVMTSYTNGNQEARGFLASAVARGSGATAGTTLFTLPGYAASLAALSPSGTAPGLVVFQPVDSTSNHALDVIEQKFTTSNSALAVMGTPTTFLTVASTHGLSFLVDGAQRLWVAASDTSSTTYVVLARK
ncbi:MAG TPA: hypothetical protein VN962_09125 [Polyangia bacterium]|nr:hypothetical protein [Polyangia bacterium]